MRTIYLGDIDLCGMFGCVLSSSTLEPPAPDIKLIDVPGRKSGPLDMTEIAAGDVIFKERKQEFVLSCITSEFERIKTQISNLIHGRRFDYRLSWDQDYTYSGRFAINEYKTLPSIGQLVISVISDPWKSKGIIQRSVNAAGGVWLQLECGRKQVQPIVECMNPTRVQFEGVEFRLGIGRHILSDVVFHEGWNNIYLNSYEMQTCTWADLGAGGAHSMTWGELATHTWDDVSQLGIGQTGVTARTWGDLASVSWSSIASSTWGELAYMTVDYTPPDDASFGVNIEYDWSDL